MKPSERIEEIIDEDAGCFLPEYRYRAIIQYLDEQYAKEKK